MAHQNGKGINGNGKLDHDYSSEEYDEEKESVSPLHSPNPKSKDNKSPESVEKKKPSIKDKKLMFQGHKVGGASVEVPYNNQLKVVQRDRRLSCDTDKSNNENDSRRKNKHEILERLKESTSFKSEKRFMEEFDTLGQIETPSGCELYTSKMKYLFESKGLSNEDSRIKNIIKEIDELKSKGQDITFEKFKSLIKSSYTFIRNLLHNNLIIKDYDDFKERVDHLYQNVKNDDMGGYIPASSPQLSKVDPEGFAVSICTVDGQRLNFGDVNTYVCMHQITSVVSYLNALQEHGSEVVSSYIGTEPSGQSFDSLELLKSVPHNPLISSGILTCCSLLYQEDTIDRKYEKYAQQVQRLIGGKKVHFNNEMYLSEIKRADRNYCLLYMLQEENTLPPKSDVKQIMQLYTQTCSIELELKDYAVLAASLANGGICPLTEDRVYSDPDAVKGVLSQMLCCGMNTFSGKWAFKCGLPCKSSVSGVTILVIPNTLGVAVWSPKLDKYHNSQKGCEFLSKFINEFNYHDIDYVYGAGVMHKMMTKNAFLNTRYRDSINLLYLAKDGNIREIRRALAQGCSINFSDYDSRTALHIASAEGHFEIVKYLVNHGASLLIKDYFGNTPYDEAKKYGFTEIAKYLKKCIAENKDDLIYE